MRSENLIHRIAYVFVFSPLGSLYVQQRSTDRDIFPGCWDLATGGILHREESYLSAAKRELGKRLGIYHQELKPHGEFYVSTSQCRAWGSVFSLIWDGEIQPQGRQISHWQYLNIDDLPVFLGQENITPTSYQAYLQLLGID